MTKAARPQFGQGKLPGMEDAAPQSTTRSDSVSTKPWYMRQSTWDTRQRVARRKAIKEELAASAPERAASAARTSELASRNQRNLLLLALHLGRGQGTLRERRRAAHDQDVAARTRTELAEHQQAINGARSEGRDEVVDTHARLNGAQTGLSRKR